MVIWSGPPSKSGRFLVRLPPGRANCRRNRELAFCGAEDLTPTDFYRQADADSARVAARRVVDLVRPHVPSS